MSSQPGIRRHDHLEAPFCFYCIGRSAPSHASARPASKQTRKNKGDGSMVRRHYSRHSRRPAGFIRVELRPNRTSYPSVTHARHGPRQRSLTTALRQKRPIRNGRLGEIKVRRFCRYGLRLDIERRGGRDGGGTVMPTPPSASGEYRGSSAAPTLQGEAFQFGDNFINDRMTDLRQFEAGEATSIVSLTSSICRENTYDEFRG